MERKQLAGIVFLAGMLVFSAAIYAGSLEPGAPPGPTMKTLDEVEPRIPISQDDIPLTINESGSYYLTGDVNSATTGITIDVNDVTIDLMGYSLIGPGPSSGTNYGIYWNERSNIAIRNGTIREFGDNGIYEASSDWKGREHKVTDIRAKSNGGSGILLKSSANIVSNCIAAGNGSYGIYAGSSSVVTGNTAYDNHNNGISCGVGSTVIGNAAYDNQGSGIGASYSTISANTVYSNDSVGIGGGSGSTVTGNTVYQNQGSGVYTGFGCMVTANTVIINNLGGTLGTGAGIWVNGDCLIKGNMLDGNNENNIYVYRGDNAIEENLVVDCGGGNGIYFADSDNFYANNRARNNGTNYGGFVPTGSGDGGGNAEF